MNPFRLAALAAFVAIATPALAAEGRLQDCAAGQSFSSGAITVTGAYTRATLPRAASAGGYLTIANDGAAPDRLTGASSAATSRVEVHQMRLDGDVMKMEPVEGGLEIPAGGSVALAPGGYHLMFMGLDAPFAEGECILVTLDFAVAGPLAIALNVGAVAQNEPVMAHESMAHEEHKGPDGHDMPSM